MRSLDVLNDAARARLDRLLRDSDLPISVIAKRFDLTIPVVHKRLAQLGLRTGHEQRIEGIQKRIPA